MEGIFILLLAIIFVASLIDKGAREKGYRRGYEAGFDDGVVDAKVNSDRYRQPSMRGTTHPQFDD